MVFSYQKNKFCDGFLMIKYHRNLESNIAASGVTELSGALKRFLFGSSHYPFSTDIYLKTLISVVFTDSSGAP